MDSPDLWKGAWIKMKQEWKPFSEEERPDPRVEGQSAYYGCETGCTGWIVVIVRDGKEERVGDFHFITEKALAEAQEAADRLGLPLVMEKELL